MSLINIVDDDDDIRLLLRLMLEKEGYDVVEAASGEECLDKFDSLKPDLLLLDVNMTGIEGWDVCRQIKENKQKISVPISMLSSLKTRENIRRSMEYAHADAYLTKPIDKKELLYTVKKLLEYASPS
jgi:two-component system OmpR family response regulator